MSETKFTKGPWSVDGWHTSAVIAKLSDLTYVRVAECDTKDFPNPDWKANAHLIAAAPELYEALEELMRAEAVLDDDNAVLIAARQKAAAALARARGASQ